MANKLKQCFFNAKKIEYETAIETAIDHHDY